MEIKKVNPVYSKYVERWRLYRDAYSGSGGFADGSYLVPHPLELDESGKATESFQQRKEVAWYLNYCSMVVDGKLNHLFKAPIVRSTDDPALLAWLDNVDGNGTSLQTFMRNACRDAMIYGHVFIFMDMPKSAALEEKLRSLGVITRADVLEEGITPYVYTVSPLDVLDWDLDRYGDIRWLTVIERHFVSEGRIFEDPAPFQAGEIKEFVRVWTREYTELYDETGAVPGTRDEHNLGRVPCVVLYNARGGEDAFVGRSELQDIAPLCARLYNLLSELDEWLRNQAFSILTYPVVPDTDVLTEVTVDVNGEEVEVPRQVEVGMNRLLTYNANAGTPPAFIGADPSHAKAFEERIASIVEEIHRLAHIKYKGGVSQSGVAWAYDWEQVNTSLLFKARNLEEVEKQLVDLWALWNSPDPSTPYEYDFSVQYPDSFTYSDVSDEVEILSQAQTIAMPKSMWREILRRAVRRLLPNMDQETLQEIDSEIDNMASPNEPEDTSASSFDLGIVRRIRAAQGGGSAQ